MRSPKSCKLNYFWRAHKVWTELVGQNSEHVSGFLSYISRDFASKASSNQPTGESGSHLTSCDPQQWHPYTKTVPDKKARNPANEAGCRTVLVEFGKVLVEAQSWDGSASCLVAKMHSPGIFRKCPALLEGPLMMLFASIGLSNSIVCPCLSRAAIC